MASVEEPGGIDAWRAFLLTHAAVVRRLERDLEHEQHLPLAWYDVLLELNAAPGLRLRMSELGQRTVLSRTRVSRVVDELAALIGQVIAAVEIDPPAPVSGYDRDATAT